MKKVWGLFLATLAIATFGTAQAATIYKKDGLTYKIKGDWQIQFCQDPGKDQDLDLEYDDLELKNSIEYDLGNNLTAFGELDFGFKDAADKSNEDKGPHLEEAYLGFGFQNVSILFGKTTSAADEFGISGDKEGPNLPSNVFGEFGATDGDDLIKMTAEVGEVMTIVTAYEIEADSEKSDGNGALTDVFLSAAFSGVTIGAAYLSFEAAPDEDGNESDTIDMYGVSLGYATDTFEIAADYSVCDDADASVYNIFVGIPVKPFKIGLGYQVFDQDKEDDLQGWYANATYTFPTQENVSLLAEVSGDDGEDSDPGFVLGASIKF